MITATVSVVVTTGIPTMWVAITAFRVFATVISDWARAGDDDRLAFPPHPVPTIADVLATGP